MSIHSEYSRVLETLIDRLRHHSHTAAADWRQELEAARVGAHPDLSAAARASLDVLARIASDPVARETPGLADPHDRLAAHCEVILGLQAAVERLPKGASA